MGGKPTDRDVVALVLSNVLDRDINPAGQDVTDVLTGFNNIGWFLVDNHELARIRAEAADEGRQEMAEQFGDDPFGEIGGEG